VLPGPARSAADRAPIRATRRAAIERPGRCAVLRVVEVPPCSKARKIVFPVCRAGCRSRVAHREAHADLLQARDRRRPPRARPLALFGDLMACPQVEQHLTQPPASPTKGVGHVRLHVADQLQAPSCGAHGQGPQGVTQSRPPRRSRPVPFSCRPRSGEKSSSRDDPRRLSAADLTVRRHGAGSSAYEVFDPRLTDDQRHCLRTVKSAADNCWDHQRPARLLQDRGGKLETGTGRLLPCGRLWVTPCGPWPCAPHRRAGAGQHVSRTCPTPWSVAPPAASVLLNLRQLPSVTEEGEVVVRVEVADDPALRRSACASR